ncbi:MAG TPA: beta-N-acetylhexosaminidase [Gemmatimonadaceae bacterium]
MPRTRITNIYRAALITAAVSIAACRPTSVTPPTTGPAARPTPVLMTPLSSLAEHHVVPMPVSVTPVSGTPFTLSAGSSIVVPAGSADVAKVGEALAFEMRPSTGFQLPVVPLDAAAPNGSIVLRLGGAPSLGAEGYELIVVADSVRITAGTAAGLFHGIQTLRQLLPAAIEAQQSVHRSASAWTVPQGRIVDSPRFAWRGSMLDVSRHFFTVDEVKQLIDILALYKLNTLHLHLSDDQGWRIQIDSWPRLAQYGGSTQVGGGPGGYFTKADYAELVRYAQDRFITIVPEIDMPAHSNAAIASYPELGCSRSAPDTPAGAPGVGLYTGIHVGWSALCFDKDTVFKFINDVVGELAAMTPGPFIHVGGDEVQVLTPEQYAAFIDHAQDIVIQHGKRMIGWDEIGRAHLKAGSVAQMWRSDTSMAAAKQGAKLVMSPATQAYLDMKYTPATELGLDWAAFIELRNSYDWDPVTQYKGVNASDVLGVEAPLWSETVQNITAAEYLIMPRLPAIAEVGWSPTSTHDWDSFRTRIAAHAPRWRLLGINYYASPQVAW